MADDPKHSSDLPDESAAADDAVEMVIDGCLDLHMFTPREVKDLVPDYIEACLERNIYEIRIVHGKGIGALRTIVHAQLDRHPAVVSYGHRSDAGSWGATVVQLRDPVDAEPD